MIFAQIRKKYQVGLIVIIKNLEKLYIENIKIKSIIL